MSGDGVRRDYDDSGLVQKVGFHGVARDFYLFIYLFLFIYSFIYLMKSIVKLVSMQHPVLIPKGALLNTHRPPSPPSHPPSTLRLFSVFKSLLCFGSLRDF